MKPRYDLQKHHRRSIRLKGYDYSSAGAYFITVVTQGREFLFGEIVDKEIVLNDAGRMILKWWNELPHKFSNINLGEFIVMPNHFHGIIFIIEPVGPTCASAQMARALAQMTSASDPMTPK